MDRPGIKTNQNSSSVKIFHPMSNENGTKTAVSPSGIITVPFNLSFDVLVMLAVFTVKSFFGF
ncbi:hypothetical protein AWW68_11415 [Roseivirga spongicola]|uniref:Uncharacterized protein n=1 Tax=Roseivirga spongicola TaxID=333140 RepID=A0A150X3K4_9BACT|nr:hypothetical protein AWW68_11415 [Roseivirga spongicola]